MFRLTVAAADTPRQNPPGLLAQIHIAAREDARAKKKNGDSTYAAVPHKCTGGVKLREKIRNK